MRCITLLREQLGSKGQILRFGKAVGEVANVTVRVSAVLQNMASWRSLHATTRSRDVARSLSAFKDRMNSEHLPSLVMISLKT